MNQNNEKNILFTRLVSVDSINSNDLINSENKYLIIAFF